MVALYRKLMDNEKTKEVRIAVLQSMPLGHDTVADIIQRTADIVADVRRAALHCLRNVPMQVRQAYYFLVKVLVFLDF